MDNNPLHNCWLEMQAYREVCHVWMRYIWRIHGVKPSSIGYSAEGSAEYRSAQASLQKARRILRPAFTYEAFIDRQGARQKGIDTGVYFNRVQVVKSRIIANAKAIYGKERPRSNIIIQVGGKAVGTGSKGVMRGSMTLNVGYMWNRIVLPLYKHGFESNDWMVLSANLLKVNAKHVKLYECGGYNPRLDENKRVYLAEKTLGKHKVYFGHSIQSVLDQVEEAVQREVHREMIGENNDEHDK